jgi:hypothetical protein
MNAGHLIECCVTAEDAEEHVGTDSPRAYSIHPDPLWAVFDRGRLCHSDYGMRLGLGDSILPRARDAYAARLATWEAWEDVANAAMGKPKKTMAAWIDQLAQGAQDRA